MLDYRAAYDLIMKLQEQLEQDHDDRELNRPDYRKVQALAATYTLQEYLANVIAELKSSGELEPEKEGAELYEEEDPKEEAFWHDLMHAVAQEEGAKLLTLNKRLKNDPAFAVPEHLDKRSLETIRKMFERENTPERIQQFLEAIAAVWKEQPESRFGQLVLSVVPNERDLYFIEEEAFLEKLQQKIAD